MTGNASIRRSGCVWVLVATYLLLLGISHAVRLARSDPPTLQAGQRAALLRAVAGERMLDDEVRLVYEDHAPAVATDSCVLLIHGSPGNKENFAGMVPGLTRSHRVIVPDLPGFGGSRAELPDYSTRAHARYLLQLMDRLEIERAHLVGFSMGGGVGLELYDLAPARVRSLTLLSAIGVQEYELFGSYRLNHLVHTAQLAALWLVHEALPHMGLLDGTMLDVAYARNFHDTDQRPLRSILERFRPPMLIVHGERDFLVLPDAAREHHRIVPHSELQMLPDGHFMVFMKGEQTAERIADFLERVEDGRALDRAGAAAERLERAAAEFDANRVPPFGGVGLVLVLLLIAVSTLVSEDLACVAVGLLVAQGRVDFLPGVLACFLGIYVGDVALYLAGRVLGRPALDRPPLSWLIRPEHVAVSSEWFNRRGPIVIALSRFVPGTRLPTYFAAGMLRTGFWSFCLYFFVAVAIWTPLLVGLSAVLGERAFAYVEAFQRHVWLALILLGLWILVVVRILLPLFSFRGRRLLRARFRRARNWEFWPPWLFYPPVLVHILLLGLRHRSPLLFTAANPAIVAGGFISESKHEILEGLSASRTWVAATRLLPAALDTDARVAGVRKLMDERGLDLPIVLKPDAGQRGSGVVVVRSFDEVRAYLKRSDFDVVAQEYVAGDEFGIFYYRYPDRERGELFSITEKHMPVLVGDGKHTLEGLILRDRRAVCMFDDYCRVQARQLGRVPTAGERVQLVEIGTHCRGAIFLDGSAVRTSRLADRIDEISRAYPGFYFGRYDLRTRDVERLKRGEGFKIVELNGVTSEATHIYDPRIGLFEAYRTLFEQWRIAFEIGRQNRAAGARPVGPARLWELIRRYRDTSRNHPL